MSRRMYRYEIPVRDEWVSVKMTHDAEIVSAFCRDEMTVEFWAEHDDDYPSPPRSLRVFGTGHDLPAGARWVATCPRTMTLGLVWHLYENRSW